METALARLSRLGAGHHDVLPTRIPTRIPPRVGHAVALKRERQRSRHIVELDDDRCSDDDRSPPAVGTETNALVAEDVGEVQGADR